MSAVRPPKQRRSRESYERVLDAAHALLEENGFEGLTVQEVASAVGRVGRRDLRALRQQGERCCARSHARLMESMSEAGRAGRGIRRRAADGAAAAIVAVVGGMARIMNGNRKALRAFMHLGAVDEVISARGSEASIALSKAFKGALMPYRSEFRHPDPEVALDVAFRVAYSTLARQVMYGPVFESDRAAELEAAGRRARGRLRRVFAQRAGDLSRARSRRREMSLPLLSQLAHVELTTSTPAESLQFWTQVVGLEETAQAGQSVYLRGWGDRFHHTLQLTEGAAVGLGHVGWRAAGPEELEQAVARLSAAGAGEGWVEDSVGHGRAFRYRAPGGHLHEVFWDVERYTPPPGMESPFPNRPQRYVPRGVAARCIDHVTITAADPRGDAEWYRDTLGHRFMEYTVIPDRPDFPVFCMTTVCERSHDLGIVWDPTPVPGRVNHFAYFVDSREELLRAADVFLNQDVAIEFGPGRHGMGEQDYLYVRDPSGMRVEINAGGYRNYEPDWEPVRLHAPAGVERLLQEPGDAAVDVRVLPVRGGAARRRAERAGQDRPVRLMTAADETLAAGKGWLLARLEKGAHPLDGLDPDAARATIDCADWA